MDKKFILTDETQKYLWHVLYRIKALKDFGDVKAGELGGWVEREENLSQEGNCWIYDDAKVYDNAKVHDNARILNKAIIRNNAHVFDSVSISDEAVVYDNATLRNYVKVYDDASIGGNALIWDYAKIYGYAKILGNVIIRDRAQIYDDAKIFGNAIICDDAQICGYAEIHDGVSVHHTAKVYHHARICGNANVCRDAEITEPEDILWITGIGSRYGTTTVCRSKNGELIISCGCFLGTLEEFITKVENTHGDNTFGLEYKVFIEMVKIHFAYQTKPQGWYQDDWEKQSEITVTGDSTIKEVVISGEINEKE